MAFEFVMVVSLDDITIANLQDKFGSARDSELLEILGKIWKLQDLLELHKEHGKIGPRVQKQCNRIVSGFHAMASTESSEPSKTFSNMLDMSLSLVNDHVTACVSPQPTSATPSTRDGDDDFDKFRTPHQGTYRHSATAASPGGASAKELVWSPANIVSNEGQSAEEKRKKRGKPMDGTFLDRRARYQAFAVKFIQTVLRSENASRIQAQKPPISPADVSVLIRKGTQLGISRDALAERYAEVDEMALVDSWDS